MSDQDDERLVEAVDDARETVKTSNLDISFNELVDMYRSKELVINPDFQRLFRWTEGAQSRFIESLLLELPVPPIYLMEREEGVYELIDGLQRISTYLNFRGALRNVDGGERPALVLVDCDLIPQLNGRTYDSLPLSVERKLKRNFIRAEILRSSSDTRLRYHMFKRLNTGGAQLEPQEIRNCTIRLLDSTFYDLIAKLADEEDFKFCISTVDETLIDQRYAEELVLRFMAFKYGADRYRKMSLDDFLTDFLERVVDQANEGYIKLNLDDAADAFRTTFKLLADAARARPSLDDRIFGAININGKIRGQFSVYHFEMYTLGLQPHLDRLRNCSASDLARFAEKIEEIKLDPELLKHIGGGKNNFGAFQARVAYVSDHLATV
jgi:hypothetical protein